MEADRLGDDAAPARLEGAHDVAVGLGRRRRGEEKRVLEPQPRKSRGELSSHRVLAWKALTIALSRASFAGSGSGSLRASCAIVPSGFVPKATHSKGE